MYLVLLAFGAVLTVAGLMLTAAGVSLHDHSLDGSIVTPGIVAIVGGLLLIGLGVGLRVLRRIEVALAARPVAVMPQSVATAFETAEPMLTAERPAIAAPTKLAPRPQTIAVAPSAEEKRLDDLLRKTTAAAKLETTRVVEETELSLSPKAPSPFSLAGEPAEIDRGRGARRRDVASRITPRLDIGARSPAAPERAAGPTFEGLWPKGPRPARTASQAAVAPAVEPEQNSEPELEAPETVDVNGAVSVLKSGVVDGMAYTLFSDGSIEAQLPQGTLRFGSITELRNHIEQSA